MILNSFQPGSFAYALLPKKLKKRVSIVDATIESRIADIESKITKIVNYLNAQGIKQPQDGSTISRNILGD